MMHVRRPSTNSPGGLSGSNQTETERPNMSGTDGQWKAGWQMGDRTREKRQVELVERDGGAACRLTAAQLFDRKQLTHTRICAHICCTHMLHTSVHEQQCSWTGSQSLYLKRLKVTYNCFVTSIIFTLDLFTLIQQNKMSQFHYCE